jgi:hypothetical protein
LIPEVIDHHGLTEHVREERMRIEWRKLVGQVIGLNARPGTLRRGVLELLARTSVWMHELQPLRGWLMSQINFGMGRPQPRDPALVTDMRLRLSGRGSGPMYDEEREEIVRALDAEQQARRRPPVRQPPTLDAEARDAISRDVTQVEDPDLRATIERVRRRWNC